MLLQPFLPAVAVAYSKNGKSLPLLPTQSPLPVTCGIIISQDLFVSADDGAQGGVGEWGKPKILQPLVWWFSVLSLRIFLSTRFMHALGFSDVFILSYCAVIVRWMTTTMPTLLLTAKTTCLKDHVVASIEYCRNSKILICIIVYLNTFIYKNPRENTSKNKQQQTWKSQVWNVLMD